MIERLTLANFKAFKELKNLGIKPITILCGTNSCGKSSILQSLLLFKQTIESQDPKQTLLLNGRSVHLGSLENIVYQKDLENRLSFSFTFKFTPKEFRLSRRGHFMSPSFILGELFQERRDESNLAECRIFFNVVIKSTKPRAGAHLLSEIVVHEMEFRAEGTSPDQNTFPGASLRIENVEEDWYKIWWKNVRPRFFAERTKTKKKGEFYGRIEFGNFLPIAVFNEGQTESSVVPPEIMLINRAVSEALKRFFASYTYIGPLREEPSRRYIYEEEIVEIGTKGENAAYIYLSEHDKPIAPHYLLDVAKNAFEKGERGSLSATVSYWLTLMGINAFQPEYLNGIIYLNLDSASSDRTRVSIADVGFGVSQVFPIILEGLRMPSSNTLLLEQPEIHLHPKLQMQLADYFICLALSGKRVIVETHSDHIINRLVRRIVEDESYNLRDLIGIYFITSTNEGAVYEEVRIDDKKGIVNWPVDFFDQTASEQERIMTAGLKKRKAVRAKEDAIKQGETSQG